MLINVVTHGILSKSGGIELVYTDLTPATLVAATRYPL